MSRSASTRGGLACICELLLEVGGVLSRYITLLAIFLRTQVFLETEANNSNKRPHIHTLEDALLGKLVG